MPCVKSDYWGAEREAYKLGLVPIEPTEKDINERLDRLREYYGDMTPEERKSNKGHFMGDGLFEESEYWKIQDKARNINMNLPTLEEFGQEVDVTPTYNCKTGKDWESEKSIRVINPLGWKNQEAFENERIPWFAYCDRRGASDCDWTGHVQRRKELLKTKNRTYRKFLLEEAELGDEVYMWSGQYGNQNCTILEKQGAYVKVKLEKSGDEVLAFGKNGVDFKQEEIVWECSTQ